MNDTRIGDIFVEGSRRFRGMTLLVEKCLLLTPQYTLLLVITNVTIKPSLGLEFQYCKSVNPKQFRLVAWVSKWSF